MIVVKALDSLGKGCDVRKRPDSGWLDWIVSAAGIEGLVVPEQENCQDVSISCTCTNAMAD